MMKLTVVVLLCLIGVAIATAGYKQNYGGNGAYSGGAYGAGVGGNRGGVAGYKKESSSSSESEEKKEKPKECKLSCTSNPQVKIWIDGVPQVKGTCRDTAFSEEECTTCCEAWGLSKGLEKTKVIGGQNVDESCMCCFSECL